MADWRVVLMVEATVVMRARLMVEMMVLGKVEEMDLSLVVLMVAKKVDSMASCSVEALVEWMDDLMVD